MKTRFNKFCLASVVAASLSLGACSDFLDKEPLAQGTDARHGSHYVQDS